MPKQAVAIRSFSNVRDHRVLLGNSFALALATLREERVARKRMESAPAAPDPSEIAASPQADANAAIDAWLTLHDIVSYHTLQLAALHVNTSALVLTLDSISKSYARDWVPINNLPKRPENATKGGVELWPGVSLIEAIRGGGDWYRHFYQWERGERPSSANSAILTAMKLTPSSCTEQAFAYEFMGKVSKRFKTYLHFEEAFSKALREAREGLKAQGYNMAP